MFRRHQTRLYLHGERPPNPQGQELNLGIQRNVPFTTSQQDGDDIQRSRLSSMASPAAPWATSRSLLPPLGLDYRISLQSHLKLEQSPIFWLASSVKNLP